MSETPAKTSQKFYHIDASLPLPTIFAALEKRKAMTRVAVKETLERALNDLETTRMDILNRWATPDDFMKARSRQSLDASHDGQLSLDRGLSSCSRSCSRTQSRLFA